TSQGELFPNNQLSTFGEDPNGELYAAALNQGIIYKVKETTTAIEDPLQAKPLRIFPQPMQESTHIEWPGNGGKFTLRLYDLQGREVVKVNDIQGNTYRLDRNRLPAGWYRIEVTGATRFAGNLLIVD
ncbi:MAG: T9SS C-terminal target domain-containing protein, partial [Bacteroidetes bacterium]